MSRLVLVAIAAAAILLIRPQIDIKTDPNTNRDEARSTASAFSRISPSASNRPVAKPAKPARPVSRDDRRRAALMPGYVRPKADAPAPDSSAPTPKPARTTVRRLPVRSTVEKQVRSPVEKQVRSPVEKKVRRTVEKQERSTSERQPRSTAPKQPGRPEQKPVRVPDQKQGRAAVQKQPRKTLQRRARLSVRQQARPAYKRPVRPARATYRRLLKRRSARRQFAATRRQHEMREMDRALSRPSYRPYYRASGRRPLRRAQVRRPRASAHKTVLHRPPARRELPRPEGTRRPEGFFARLRRLLGR